MSRGPGSVQKFLVARLVEAGEWRGALELADDLHRSRGGAGPIPEATYRTVLRAIHGLDDSGQVRVAHLPMRRGERGRQRTLVCWLPDQEPPAEPGFHFGRRYGQADAPAVMMDARVRVTLKHLVATTGRFVVRYLGFCHRVAKRFDMGHVPYVPVRRSLYRMARLGQVRLITEPRGRGEGIVSIELLPVSIVSAPCKTFALHGALTMDTGSNAS